MNELVVKAAWVYDQMHREPTVELLHVLNQYTTDLCLTIFDDKSIMHQIIQAVAIGRSEIDVSKDPDSLQLLVEFGNSFLVPEHVVLALSGEQLESHDCFGAALIAEVNDPLAKNYRHPMQSIKAGKNRTCVFPLTAVY